jgi:hypothetical protein
MGEALITDWISAVANGGIAISAVIAAYQGVKSLKSWREESVGNRRMDLAEGALSTFLEVLDALKSIRLGFTYAEKRQAPEGESDTQKSAKDAGYSILEGFYRHSELFSKFNVQSYRVRALFGPDFYAPYDEIRKSMAQIRSAAIMLMRTPYNGYNDRNLEERLYDRIWDHDSDDPSSIERKIERSVAGFEALIKPHLK